MARPLLSIRNLKTYFFTEEGVVKAVDGIRLEIGKEEAVGLVGESGCGKTVTALSIMRLIPNPGRIVDGEIIFDGEDLLKKTENEMRKIRGNKISMVFQDPMTSLNPVFTIGDQIAEAIELHRKLSKQEAIKETIRILELVGIPEPSSRVKEYPHQFSGGMRQRVMIAMAISTNPSLLIADEPTTALDVMTQAQILELLCRLKKEFKLSVLLITHNLGVAAEFCDRIAVMYAGKIVESADTKTLFEKPKHPYTQALLKAIIKADSRNDLETIQGSSPNPLNMPTGCRFHPRCPYAKEICSRREPETIEVTSGHYVKCFLYA